MGTESTPSAAQASTTPEIAAVEAAEKNAHSAALKLKVAYAAKSIRKSSICFPDLSCAVNQRGLFPRLSKFRTAPRDFYISETPSGKGAARDLSS
jgi:hypothetical protein